MNTRKLWFITRPERDPKFHPDALEALYRASEKLNVKWYGNRSLHKKYEEELGNMGLKRNKVSNDGSGGRTWFAMLKTFAYCYLNADGYVALTKAGSEILKGRNVYENVKKQILTLQIPNAYFLDSSFRPKFDHSFRIRPVMYLLRLIHAGSLDYYITKEEITFFVLQAKQDLDLEYTIALINEFRNSSEEQKNKMRITAASENEHRERSDKEARSFYSAHSDVAHTFMLLSEFTGLAEYIRGDALRAYSNEIEETESELNNFLERYPFNTRYMISLDRMMESNGLDIYSYKANKLGNIKPAANSAKMNRKINKILEKFPNIESIDSQELVNRFQKELPPKEAVKIAEEVMQYKVPENLSPSFVESYLNEEDNTRFEDKTGEIFKSLGFKVVMRPSSPDSGQTEIEILLEYGAGKMGIIDAKNYKDKFSLSAALTSHMASEYIPNYLNYDNKELTFFGYVTAAAFSGEKNLKKVSERAKPHTNDVEVPGIMLNAKTLLGLLDYCIENEVSLDARPLLFLKAVKNRGYKSVESMLNELKH